MRNDEDIVMCILAFALLILLTGCAAQPVNHAQQWDCDATGACWRLGVTAPEHRVVTVKDPNSYCRSARSEHNSKWLAAHAGAEVFACTIGSGELPSPIVVLPETITPKMTKCGFTPAQLEAHEVNIHVAKQGRHNMIARKEGC